MSRKNIIGLRYNHLTVIARVPGKTDRPSYYCLCDCGATIEVDGRRLTKQKYAKYSCGCERKPRNRDSDPICNTPLYHKWESMMAAAKRNGQSVFAPWFKSNLFIGWAKRNGYSEGKRLFRKDSSLGYYPENVGFRF